MKLKILDSSDAEIAQKFRALAEQLENKVDEGAVLNVLSLFKAAIAITRRSGGDKLEVRFDKMTDRHGSPIGDWEVVVRRVDERGGADAKTESEDNA